MADDTRTTDTRDENVNDDARNKGANDSKYIQRMLQENWRREMEAAQLYRLSANAERDARRRQILMKLADVELNHAKMWKVKLADHGVEVAQLQAPEAPAVELSRRDLINRIESIESGNATWYASLRNVIADEEILRILDQIDADEADHQEIGELFESRQPQQLDRKLSRIWGDERWHKSDSGGWVGDAIYGVNDGLGAIFGIIAGVAGYTNSSHTVLVSGFFGALASTLSMGAGAWLSTKSKNELMESEIEQERREIAEDPAHELEELALLYELKGFSEEDAHKIANQIGQNPELLLKTMAQEELGIHEAAKGNPWKSALFGSVSTLVGGIIPLIPFFFMQGLTAMITAAIVSIIAHFAVGAAKSTMTVRSWWASGLEMTLVGVIVGVVSYGLGVLGSVWLG